MSSHRRLLCSLDLIAVLLLAMDERYFRGKGLNHFREQAYR